jgi:hypothetical protein
MKITRLPTSSDEDGFEELREAFEQYWEADREEDSFAHLCQAFRLFWDEEGQDDSQSILRELMALIGLKDIKAQFLKLKAKLEIAQRQEIDLSEEDFSVNVVGNSGTGKFLS